MNVAVTGGSGVVGGAVLDHLVADGHEVKALARSAEAKNRVAAHGAEPISGDVLDPHSLRNLVDSADWVFHVAGVNEMCSLEPELMDRVNVVGTSNVVRACQAGGVRRLIHTSSAVAIGEETGTFGSEESRHRGRYLTRYERSKHLSELLVLEERAGLEVVVVNPSSVQGPGRATGTAKLILGLLQGRLPLLVDSHISIVDIDDCASGHLLAAQRGEPGRRYLLNGASLRFSEAVALVRHGSGRQVAERYLPATVVSALAGAVEAGFRLVDRRPPLCREMARVLRHGHRYDGSRATRELGLVYRPLGDTLRRTIDWFQSEGLLPPRL